MDNQTEYGEYTSSPLEQVRQFVTKVWEHPLVDEQTRKHRELAKTKLDILLKKFGVDPLTYITIPVGSLIWATDEKSDFDYQLALLHKDTLNSIDQKSLRSELDREGVNIVKIYNFDEAFQDKVDSIILLLTPDNYIGGGNIQLAKDFRLKAVNYLDSLKVGMNTYLDTNIIMNEYFDIFFRNWDDTSSFLSGSFRKDKPSDRNRSMRISSRLEQRAQQTHNPDRYKETFKKARKNLTIPNINTYLQAMNRSQRALNLLPRFAAIGI